MKGHEEDSQETQIEMEVLAWPARGGIKRPETEMMILSARQEVVQQNVCSSSLRSELDRCAPQSQFCPYQLGDLGISYSLLLSLCFSICKMGMGHPAIRAVRRLKM